MNEIENINILKKSKESKRKNRDSKEHKSKFISLSNASSYHRTMMIVDRDATVTYVTMKYSRCFNYIASLAILALYLCNTIILFHTFILFI